MTEKETEALLELQTKELPMPDGSRKPLTAFKFTWDDFAYLSECSCFTGSSIIKIAQINGEEVGIPFEESFPAMVTFLRRKIRDNGLDQLD